MNNDTNLRAALHISCHIEIDLDLPDTIAAPLTLALRFHLLIGWNEEHCEAHSQTVTNTLSVADTVQ